jgi:hypothetical protein
MYIPTSKLFSMRATVQWLPDGFFSEKNPNLGIFWKTLEWNRLLYILDILEYSTTIGHTLLVFAIFFSDLVYCANKNLATLHYTYLCLEGQKIYQKKSVRCRPQWIQCRKISARIRPQLRHLRDQQPGDLKQYLQR